MTVRSFGTLVVLGAMLSPFAWANANLTPNAPIDRPLELPPLRPAESTRKAADPIAEGRVLKRLHHANVVEVRVGYLASGKGHDPQVRRFGDMLVKDHAAMDTKVAQVAALVGIELARGGAALTPEDKTDQDDEADMFALLESRLGDAFDVAVARSMDRAHRRLIDLLVVERGALKGTRTGDLIEEVLPTLREHDTMAMALTNRIAAAE